ncbi:4271_t:CDS:2, partial [Scutellospora calospora]
FVVLSGYYRGPAQKYIGGKCRNLEGLNQGLCEDIRIHHTSGHAYLACGDEHGHKTQWWPPLNVYNNYSYQSRDTFYVYNIE